MSNTKGFERSREIKLSDGRAVKITGIKLKSVPIVTATIMPVMLKLAQSEGAKGTEVFVIFSKILEEHAESLFSIMADTSSLTVDEAKDLDLDDGVEVLTGIFELNREFFEKKILPLLQGTVLSKTQAKAT